MKNKDFDKNSHDIDLFGLMSITTGYEDQDWNQEYLIGKEIDALIEMGLIKIEKGFIIWQYPDIKSQIFEELIKLSKEKRLRWMVGGLKYMILIKNILRCNIMKNFRVKIKI